MLFENLESRRLMSFTFSVVDGILTVDGSDANDQISVRDRWDTAEMGDVDITQRDPADPENPDTTLTMGVTGVTVGIILNLYGGYNIGSIDTGGVEAAIHGGDGRDEITVYNNGGPFAVSTGAGEDVVLVNDYEDVGTIVLAGQNNDTIVVGRSSSSSDSPTVVYGGSGDDYLQGEVADGACLIDSDDDGVFDSIVYNDAVFGYARLYGGNGKDYLVSYHENTEIDGENGKDEEVIFEEDAARLAAMVV